MFKDDDKHETCYCENCLELQQKLQAKEQECEELKKEINGYKIISEQIKQEVQEDVTCESRECGCDSYEEYIECLKNTILNIIDEGNDFVQGRVICKECGKYKKALEDIEINISKYQELTFDKPRTMRETRCIYNILNIINKTKDYKTMNTNEQNQKEMQFIYGERKGCTAIYAIDKPSPNNNSYHEFIINYEPDSETSDLLGRIKLQNGNFKEFGHNGIFTEHLLVIARDCLERFNTSKYACQENTLAINSINTALMWLNKRATERVKRGVYGTETV